MFKKSFFICAVFFTVNLFQPMQAELVILREIEDRMRPLASGTRDCFISCSAYVLSIVKTTQNLFKDESELPFIRDQENPNNVSTRQRKSRKEIQNELEQKIYHRMHDLLRPQTRANESEIVELNETESVVLLPTLIELPE